MLLKSAMSVNKLLKNKKSFVSFCIHDSIIVDMVKEDRPLIEQLQQTFSKTMFGTLKTNVSLGKDFGSMRKIS